MQYVIIFLVIIRIHRILSFLALFGVGLLVYFLSVLTSGMNPAPFIVLLYFIYFITIFAGHFAINFLLEYFGDEGEGRVVDITQTSDLYNDQPVLCYDVMIKANDQQPVSTYCLTSDFNISHPESWNEYFYPETGISFNVWFLKGYPRAFVIIGNDDSDYARTLQREKKAKEINRPQIS